MSLALSWSVRLPATAKGAVKGKMSEAVSQHMNVDDWPRAPGGAVSPTVLLLPLPLQVDEAVLVGARMPSGRQSPYRTYPSWPCGVWAYSQHEAGVGAEAVSASAASTRNTPFRTIPRGSGTCGAHQEFP